jgi:hypothetical protein
MELDTSAPAWAGVIMDRLSAIEAKITDIDKRLQAATGRAKSPRALFS